MPQLAQNFWTHSPEGEGGIFMETGNCVTLDEVSCGVWGFPFSSANRSSSVPLVVILHVANQKNQRKTYMMPENLIVARCNVCNAEEFNVLQM